MEEWQARLIEESVHLEDKLEKLRLFMETDGYGKLSSEERRLLDRQETMMTFYAEILSRRLTLHGI